MVGHHSTSFDIEMSWLVLLSCLALSNALPPIARHASVGEDGALKTTINGRDVVVVQTRDADGHEGVKISINGRNIAEEWAVFEDANQPNSRLEEVLNVFRHHQGPIDEGTFRNLVARLRDEVQEGHFQRVTHKLIEKDEGDVNHGGQGHVKIIKDEEVEIRNPSHQDNLNHGLKVLAAIR